MKCEQHGAINLNKKMAKCLGLKDVSNT